MDNQTNKYDPIGYPPNGYAPNGYPPNGYAPNGYPPNGYAFPYGKPYGVPQNPGQFLQHLRISPERDADFQPILTCGGLFKHYGASPYFALYNLNLQIPANKVVGLLGPNGSGKTTFIKLCNGLLKPTEGHLSIGGYIPGAETCAMVSYLPDRNSLPLSMSALDAINYFANFFSDFDRNRALYMLSILGVPHDAKIKTLSKGTREKVQLVLVMARNARLYLLDEPIAGVDPATRDFILNTIVSNRCPESTVIISTHLIQDVEPILDEFIFIRNGQLLCHDTVTAVKEHYNMSVDQLFREAFRC